MIVSQKHDDGACAGALLHALENLVPGQIRERQVEDHQVERVAFGVVKRRLAITHPLGFMSFGAKRPGEKLSERRILFYDDDLHRYTS